MMPEKDHLFHQWKDCEILFKHLGAQVIWRNSRLLISLKGFTAVFYCPDLDKEIDQYSLIELKNLLDNVREVK